MFNKKGIIAIPPTVETRGFLREIYHEKNVKKLPDEILKNEAKKNDESFFNRKSKK